ncbi:hypothetical protein [Caldiplasma sukawensis]
MIIFPLAAIMCNFFIFRFPDYATVITYYILYPLPIISILLFYIMEKEKVIKSYLSPYGIIFLFSVLIVWIYLELVFGYGNSLISYSLSSIFYPSFVELTIFAFISVEILSNYVDRGKATFLATILYFLYYFSVLINSLPGFPGIYFPIFMLDSFAIGLVYITIYSITKTIYFSVALEISLLIIINFYPLPVWFPALYYTLVPS